MAGMMLSTGYTLLRAAESSGNGSASGELAPLPTVDDWVGTAADQAPLRLRFGGNTPGELREWQERFAREIKQRMLAPTDVPNHWSAEPVSRNELTDYIREEWLLKSPDAPSVPLYVLLPSRRQFGPGPFPVVICLHGHGKFGHDPVVGIDYTPERARDIQISNYDYGRALVKQGYLVIAPCMTPFGRRLDASYAGEHDDPCAITFIRLMLMGETLIAANLRDLKWTVDYACSRPEAQSDRIGCVGLSYGGRMTMMLTAFEQRIRVAVISGALNLMQERTAIHYNCGAQVIPGLLEIGDTAEIGSLIAPRPCLWEYGAKDPLIKPAWAAKMIERMNHAYTAAGAAKNLQFDHHDGAHQWHGEKAYPLLRQVLLN